MKHAKGIAVVRGSSIWGPLLFVVFLGSAAADEPWPWGGIRKVIVQNRCLHQFLINRRSSCIWRDRYWRGRIGHERLASRLNSGYLDLLQTMTEAPAERVRHGFGIVTIGSIQLAWDTTPDALFCIEESMGIQLEARYFIYRMKLDSLDRYTPISLSIPFDPESFAKEQGRYLESAYSPVEVLTSQAQYVDKGDVLYYDVRAMNDRTIRLYQVCGNRLCTWTGENGKWEEMEPYPCSASGYFRIATQSGQTYACFPNELYRLGDGTGKQGTMVKVGGLKTDLLIVDKDSGWNYCYADGEVRVLAHPEIKAKVVFPPAQEGQDEQARKDAETLHIVKTALALPTAQLKQSGPSGTSPTPQPKQPEPSATRATRIIMLALAIVATAAVFLVLLRRFRRRTAKAGPE